MRFEVRLLKIFYNKVQLLIGCSGGSSVLYSSNLQEAYMPNGKLELNDDVVQEVVQDLVADLTRSDGYNQDRVLPTFRSEGLVVPAYGRLYPWTLSSSCSLGSDLHHPGDPVLLTLKSEVFQTFEVQPDSRVIALRYIRSQGSVSEAKRVLRVELRPHIESFLKARESRVAQLYSSPDNWTTIRPTVDWSSPQANPGACLDDFIFGDDVAILTQGTLKVLRSRLRDGYSLTPEAICRSFFDVSRVIVLRTPYGSENFMWFGRLPEDGEIGRWVSSSGQTIGEGTHLSATYLVQSQGLHARIYNLPGVDETRVAFDISETMGVLNKNLGLLVTSIR